MKRTLLFSAAILFCGALGGCQQNGGPLRVDSVSPDQGVMPGGDRVTIKGGGFEPGKTQVEVRFGRAKAEQVEISSGDQITVVTPPGSRGPVDVTLMFDNGAQFKIPNGYRYIAQTAADDVRRAFLSGKTGAPK